MHALEHRAFLVLLSVVTLAFGWILLPFFGALFWAAIIAIVFDPLYRHILAKMPRRQSLACAVMVTLILVIVILPLVIIGLSLVREASDLYAAIQSGQFDFVRIVQPAFDALPSWATGPTSRTGLTDLAAVREKIVKSLTSTLQYVATQSVSIGQGTFAIVADVGVMLYLLFFLLRDGEDLVNRVSNVTPLRPAQRAALFTKFTLVVRATVKGQILVALLQGMSGGFAFWILGIHSPILWAVLMAVLSLLPAIGAALVWFPIAIYLLIIGAIWQGVLLMAFGIVFISLIDNILRPLMIGQATEIPDYVVLISALGGIATFGIHGFIIGPVVAAMFIGTWDIYTSEARPIAP